MIKKIEGIVLTERIYNDSSKIVQILTSDYGLIDVLAKGARNIKSPLRSGTSKLIQGDFYIYYKEDKLSTLSNVDILNNFKNIQKDITKISYASYVLDLASQIVKQNNDSNIYKLLLDTLNKMEQGYDLAVLSNILELKYLDYLGVRPMIDSCSICGATTSIVTLSSERGGYVCKNCITNEILVNEKTIKLVRMFYYVDIAKITKLEVQEDIKKELNRFIDNYYDQYTGIYLKTKTFLKNLNKIST